MPNFRRAHIPGGSYFFTLVTADRAPFLCSENARVCLRAAITAARTRWPFRIDAMVLLPEHLHTIWTLPREDKDYSRRWGWIKKEFTKAWLTLGEPEVQVTASKRGDRRHGVWQRRFWEHVLRDDNDYERHCDYIHYNPVKHSLVRCPRDWPYSSFHSFVKAGDYDLDWGCSDRAVPQFEDLDATAME